MRWLLVAALALAASAVQAGVNTWTTAGPRVDWQLVAADPRPGGALFLDANGHSYRSTDQGLHWSPITVAGFPSAEIEAYWFDPHVAHRVYAGVSDRLTSNSLWIFYNTQTGAHFYTASEAE